MLSHTIRAPLPGLTLRRLKFAVCTALASFALTQSAPAGAESNPALPVAATSVNNDLIQSIVTQIRQQHPEMDQATLEKRVRRGVSQVQGAWRSEDGSAEEMAAFCREWFVADDRERHALLLRFAAAFEQLDGHLLEVGRAWRSWNELEIGPQMAIDDKFAAYDVGAHVTEDLFQNKIAFVALLNFPALTLDEMVTQSPGWTREQWAEARLGRRFAVRASGNALQAHAQASAAAENYIAGYNLWMHHVLDAQGQRLFPKGTRLITHWNLRDEIKAQYSDKQGLARQRVIIKLMERIVDQTIPQAVIDDPRIDWNPFTNTVALSPASETETPDPSQGKRPEKVTVSDTREPDTRYQMLQNTFRAEQILDKDTPRFPTSIKRRFELETEIPEKRVRELLEQIASAPVMAGIAKQIELRLGRPLEAHDIWYSGFLERPDESKLSALTRKRYPDAPSYKRDMPRLLSALGFTADKVKYLNDRIVVDPARGAGHALEAGRRSNLLPEWGSGDFPHLRTRISPGGMDYKGYNIAVHEMGHNVEQVFSLYGVDSTLMQGVPNTAFTEALAFTFQNRDLELLGLKKPDAHTRRLAVMNDAWATWEIAGVALVDLDVWHWMYDHPDATPAQLRAATVAIAVNVWDEFYAPTLGHRGSTILAVYSHMISSFMYLPNYPVGHLIAFGLEQKLQGPRSGAEFERVTRVGRLLPDAWMIHATGKPVIAEPLLEAAAEAVRIESAGKH